MITVASLGTIKWGIQYNVIDNVNKSKSKTLSGFNLNDAATAQAATDNANTVDWFVGSLVDLTTSTLTSASLIETRGVNF